MKTTLMNVLFVGTALVGLVGLMSLVMLSMMEGPMWIAVMAALGALVTICFGVLLLGGLLFAGFITLCRWADERNASQPL